jgi:hypothetical protein
MNDRELSVCFGTMKAEVLKEAPGLWVDADFTGDAVWSQLMEQEDGGIACCWYMPASCSPHAYMRVFHAKFRMFRAYRQREAHNFVHRILHGPRTRR